MKNLATAFAMGLALLLVLATPTYAQHGHSGGHGGFHGGGHGGWHGGGFHGGWHGGWRGGVFVGGPWWWGDPWWWGPPYLYPYPYGYGYGYYPPYADYPPPDAPSVYLQQPPPAREQPVQGYWYYCASAKGYYPKVPKCPEDWIKVPPAPK